MSQYQYSATDTSGAMVRGTIEADDHASLVKALADQGLFLISAHEIQPPPEETPPEPSTDPREQPTGLAALWANPRFRIGAEIGAIVVLAVLFVLSNRSLPTIPSPTVQKKIDRIHIGMTRADVEAALGTTAYKAGNSSSAHSRYLVDKQVLVEVDYNSEGGQWQEKNRVLTAPKVFTHIEIINNKLEWR